MDELGYLTTPSARLGYLDAQMMRAVRVIVDIGMHLELEIPATRRFHPGETWTPELAQRVLRRAQRPVRPTSWRARCPLSGDARPGDRLQAGRARLAAGPGGGPGERTATQFDLRPWHMAALSQGSLGLDDLVDELSRL